jgi:hypothetical protein
VIGLNKAANSTLEDVGGDGSLDKRQLVQPGPGNLAKYANWEKKGMTSEPQLTEVGLSRLLA